MAEANFKIRLSVDGASQVSASLSAIQGVASRVGGMLTSLAGLAGVTTGLAGMAAAIGKSVSFNAQLEQQAVAFKTLLGNADAATQRIKELTKFAAETPFELPEVVNASKVLQAMTNGAMAAGDGLRLVGDAAAASGRNLDETAMWIGRLYAGLQSGTPVGEATLRLIEMGLISGTTARKLNELAQTGEGAGKAFGIIQENFGKFSGAMKDQSQTFNGLISTLKDAANIALADVGKPLFEALKAGVAELIPVVEDVGKRMSAWVRLAIQAWRDGNLAEFIGLTIQAGVEVGMEAFNELKNRIVNVFTDQSIANAIGNATVTIIASVGKAFIDLNTFFQSYWNAVGIYAGQAIAAAIRYVINQQIGMVEGVLNAAKEAARLLNPLVPKDNIKLPRVDQTVPNFDEALSAGMAVANVMGEKQKAIVDKLVEAYRNLFGIETQITDENGKQVSAREKLRQLIEKILAADKAAADAAPKATAKTEAEVPIINARLKAQEMELTVTRALQGINQSRAAIESNWLMSSTEKYKQKVRLLEEEKAILEAQRSALGQLAGAPGISAADQMALLNAQQNVEGRMGQVDAARGQLGPDPTSYTQQFSATFRELADQAAITAQSVARTFADVFNNAIQSISSGITGLIMGTQTWGQALMNIATSILTSIVGAIVQMGVRWVATQILMATVGKSIMLASVAATAPIAAAAAAIWATPATLATIASYGAAAAAAPGFIGTAQAIVMTQSVLSAGFRDGGYTGAGAPDEVAGIVHRGEFVIPADAVNRIGLDTLEAMRAGETTGTAIPTSAGAPSPITLNMGVFDNPARLNDWARSQEGRTVLVDIMRQHAHEVGNA